MNYIFDIDGTITKELEYLKEKAPIYLKKLFGIEANVINDNAYTISEIYGLKEILRNKFLELNEEEFDLKLKKINQNFWDQHFVGYMLYELRENSKTVINTIKEQGGHIFFITSRGKKTKEKEKNVDKIIRCFVVPFLTKFQLFINNVKYDKVFCVGSDDEKLELINKIKPVLVFDDKLSLLERLPEEITPVCMTTSENSNIELKENVIRLDDFSVDKIRKVIDPKLVFFKKDNNYKFMKYVSEFMHEISRKKITNWVYKTYNPIIEGSDNIPKNKRPIVVVSTHRHNLDPLFPSVALNRPIHWTAELKMFIGKENLLFETNNPIICNFSSLIMKLYGAFPIAREKDIANYGNKCANLKELAKINSNTLKTAGKCLELGGVVGLYPEGTINRNLDNINVEKLKSERVFRLAKEHSAYVLPVSMVWTKKGEGLPRTFMQIGKPIDPSLYSIKDISTLWEETVNSDTDYLNKKIELLKLEKEKLLEFSSFPTEEKLKKVNSKTKKNI